MLSNLISQLKEQGKEDKLREVLEEVPRVRERTCVVLHLDGGLCTGLSRPRGPVFQQSHGLLVDLAICPLL